MNRAQKNTWFGLANCVLALIFFVELFLGRLCHVPAPGFRDAPKPSQIEVLLRTVMSFWPLALPVLALILLLYPRKKHSPAEPAFDELDAAIQNKAIRTCFIAVWFLWPLALVLTALKFGIYKGVPTIYYFYVHLGFFLVCMTIYFFTKIILYRKHTRDMADA